MQRRELLKLTKAQLIKRCKKCKLPTNGTKGDLVNRIIEKSLAKNTNIKKSNKKKSLSKKRTKTNKIRKTNKTKHVRHTASTGALTFKAKPKKFKIKRIQQYNPEIIGQLTQFNYDRTDILTAMDNVINKNDINSIINYIENKIRSKHEEIKTEYSDTDNDSSLSMLSIENTHKYSHDVTHSATYDDELDSPKPSSPSNHNHNYNHINIENENENEEKKVTFNEMEEKAPDTIINGFDMRDMALDMRSIDTDDTLNLLLSPSKQILTPSKRPTSFSKTPRVPNKFDIVQDLKEMGFTMDRILRAFKVYEKNYGTKYNINGLVELIQRLRMKDDENNKITEEKINMIQYDMDMFNKRNAKKKKYKQRNGKNKQKVPKLFVLHMSLQRAENLCLFDNIDHRDFTGKFCIATIVDIDPNNESNVLIHYEDDFNDKYDIWSDYKTELFRFAKPRSVSRRKQYLFNDQLKIGDHVNVKPNKFYLKNIDTNEMHIKSELRWFDGIVTAFDKKSAQIQISHQSTVFIHENNKHKQKWFIYWTHIDNIQEISKYSEKSIFPSSFYKYTQQTQHQKQSASLGSIPLESFSLFQIVQ